MRIIFPAWISEHRFNVFDQVLLFTSCCMGFLLGIILAYAPRQEPVKPPEVKRPGILATISYVDCAQMVLRDDRWSCRTVVLTEDGRVALMAGTWGQPKMKIRVRPVDGEFVEPVLLEEP